MARKKSAATDQEDTDSLEQLVRDIRGIVKYHSTHPSCEVDPETGDMWFTRELEEILVMTMRFAITMRGGAKNCRNPKCRKLGCQLRLEESGDGVCSGGIAPSDLDTAALMLAYLIHFGKRYAPWAFGLSRPQRHSPIRGNEKR